MTRVCLYLLGTAQDGGIPHPNCFCKNCSKAIYDPQFKRNAASLAIVLPEDQQWHLIDATPDLKEQMVKLQMKHNLKGKIMDSVFLTHAHTGHFPGLLFLGREMINTRELPVFAGKKMKTLLETEAPWRQLTQLNNIVVNEIENGDHCSISKNVTVIPVEVPHRNEFTETFAFWIVGPNKKVLYIPDIDRWEEWSVDIYQACREADICLLDGTFYSAKDFEHIHRDYREIPHPPMTETMGRLSDLVEETEIFFTHVNHSNPAIESENKIRHIIEEKGFNIAEDGMEFEI
ncbi:pyrroloquinoline quinone biosynthesis protein PqqB [Ornithinibacillus sp. L9]|uniref:Pyrroloquinoline quinone biosynthesis protein PqqB n=1 Tax=Ornithinibacillus caprae TaxID=2678566 RepID=A0A6N8FMJ0_9BACI|nr:MBL fold metallo-hydrolase [Ornithinibacillus caprae]MUK90553.1 pyrroloquinoline quinone biosynthesis protein PqqB [Ornithinibacillus caprae]